jgi:chromosome segregation ATPase
MSLYNRSHSLLVGNLLLCWILCWFCRADTIKLSECSSRCENSSICICTVPDSEYEANSIHVVARYILHSEDNGEFTVETELVDQKELKKHSNNGKVHIIDTTSGYSQLYEETSADGFTAGLKGLHSVDASDGVTACPPYPKNGCLSELFVSELYMSWLTLKMQLWLVDYIGQQVLVSHFWNSNGTAAAHVLSDILLGCGFFGFSILLCLCCFSFFKTGSQETVCDNFGTVKDDAFNHIPVQKNIQYVSDPPARARSSRLPDQDFDDGEAIECGRPNMDFSGGTAGSSNVQDTASDVQCPAEDREQVRHLQALVAEYELKCNELEHNINNHIADKRNGEQLLGQAMEKLEPLMDAKSCLERKCLELLKCYDDLLAKSMKQSEEYFDVVKQADLWKVRSDGLKGVCEDVTQQLDDLQLVHGELQKRYDNYVEEMRECVAMMKKENHSQARALMNAEAAAEEQLKLTEQRASEYRNAQQDIISILTDELSDCRAQCLGYCEDVKNNIFQSNHAKTECESYLSGLQGALAALEGSNVSSEQRVAALVEENEKLHVSLAGSLITLSFLEKGLESSVVHAVVAQQLQIVSLTAECANHRANTVATCQSQSAAEHDIEEIVADLDLVLVSLRTSMFSLSPLSTMCIDCERDGGLPEITEQLYLREDNILSVSVNSLQRVVSEMKQFSRQSKLVSEELCRMKDNHENLILDFSCLTATNSTQALALRELQSENSKLLLQLQQSQFNVDAATAARFELASEYQQLLSAKQLLDTKISELSSQVIDMQSRLDETGLRSQYLVSSLADERAEFADQKLVLERRTHEFLRLKETHTSEQRAWATKLDTLCLENSQLSDDLAVTSGKLANLLNEIIETVASSNYWEQRYHEQTALTRVFKNVVGATLPAMNDQSESLRSCTDYLQQLFQETELLKTSSDLLTAEISCLSTANRNLAANFTLQERESRDRAAECEHLRTSLSAKLDEVKLYYSVVEDLKRELYSANLLIEEKTSREQDSSQKIIALCSANEEQSSTIRSLDRKLEFFSVENAHLLTESERVRMEASDLRAEICAFERHWHSAAAELSSISQLSHAKDELIAAQRDQIVTAAQGWCISVSQADVERDLLIGENEQLKERLTAALFNVHFEKDRLKDGLADKDRQLMFCQQDYEGSLSNIILEKNAVTNELDAAKIFIGKYMLAQTEVVVLLHSDINGKVAELSAATDEISAVSQKLALSVQHVDAVSAENFCLRSQSSSKDESLLEAALEINDLRFLNSELETKNSLLSLEVSTLTTEAATGRQNNNRIISALMSSLSTALQTMSIMNPSLVQMLDVAHETVTESRAVQLENLYMTKHRERLRQENILLREDIQLRADNMRVLSAAQGCYCDMGAEICSLGVELSTVRQEYQLSLGRYTSQGYLLQDLQTEIISLNQELNRRKNLSSEELTACLLLIERFKTELASAIEQILKSQELSEKDLENAKSQHASFINLMAEYEMRCSALTAENNSLFQSSAAAVQSCSCLCDVVRCLLLDLDDKNCRLHSSLSDIRELQLVNSNILADQLSLKAEHHLAGECIQKLTVEFEEFVTAASVARRRQDMELCSLSQQHVQLQGFCEDKNLEVQKLTVRCDSLKNCTVASLRTLAQQNECVEKLTVAVTNRSHEVDTLSVENLELREKVDAIQAENVSLQQTVSKMRCLYDAQNDHVMETERAIALYAANVVTELMVQRTMLQEFKHELDTEQNRMTQYKDECRDEIMYAEDLLSTKRDDVNKLETECSMLRSVVRQQSSEFARLQNSCTVLQLDNIQLTQQLKNVEDSVTLYKRAQEQTILLLTEQVKDHLFSVQAAERKTVSMHDTYCACQRELAATKSENCILLDECKTVEGLCQKLGIKLEGQLSALEALQARYTKEMEEHVSIISKLQAEHFNANVQAVTGAADELDKCADLVRFLTAALQDIATEKATFTAKIDELEMAELKQREHIVQLQDSVASLATRSGDSAIVDSELDEEFDPEETTLREELNLLNNSLEEKRLNRRPSQTELAHLAEQNSGLTQTNYVLSGRLNDLESECSRLKQMLMIRLVPTMAANIFSNTAAALQAHPHSGFPTTNGGRHSAYSALNYQGNVAQNMDVDSSVISVERQLPDDNLDSSIISLPSKNNQSKDYISSPDDEVLPITLSVRRYHGHNVQAAPHTINTFASIDFGMSPEGNLSFAAPRMVHSVGAQPVLVQTVSTEYLMESDEAYTDFDSSQDTLPSMPPIPQPDFDIDFETRYLS